MNIRHLLSCLVITLCLSASASAATFHRDNAFIRNAVRKQESRCGMFGGCCTVDKIASITFAIKNGTKFVIADWAYGLDNIDLGLEWYCVKYDTDTNRVDKIDYGACE